MSLWPNICIHSQLFSWEEFLKMELLGQNDKYILSLTLYCRKFKNIYHIDRTPRYPFENDQLLASPYPTHFP